MKKNNAGTLLMTLLVSILHFFATSSYIALFNECIENGTYGGDPHCFAGFGSVLIPDTYLYRVLSFAEFDIALMLYSGVKNSLGPACLWMLSAESWIGMAVINSVFVFIFLIYMVKLSRRLMITIPAWQVLLMFFGSLPLFVFYSVGALKELPGLLFMTCFFYYYLKNSIKSYMFFMILSILFRYQLIVVYAAFIFIDKTRKKTLGFVFIFLTAFSAAYPFLNDLNIFSSTDLQNYRENSANEDSLGSHIETVRQKIPGLSAIAVCVRVLQSIFEPLLTLVNNPTFYKDGDVIVFLFVMFTSCFSLIFSWTSTFSGLFKAIIKKSGVCSDIDKLYSFLLLFIVPTGGFSFIHHRYLFPCIGLVIIAGAVNHKIINSVSISFKYCPLESSS